MINENSLGNPIAADESALNAFWQWFGNSVCKDEKGRPLVVYHGSHGDFDEFQLPHERDDAEDYYQEGYDGGNLGQGHYFTDSERYAAKFGKTKAYYLRLLNPLDCTEQTTIDEINQRFSEEQEELNYGEYGEIIDMMIIEGNHDGAIGIDVGGFAVGDKEFTILRSNQAKLVSNVKYTESDKVHEELQEIQKLAGIKRH